MLLSAADIAAIAAPATRLYKRGLEAQRPLDGVVSHFILNDLKGAPRPLRGEVARLAQAMWRRRRLLEAIGEALGPRAHRDAAAFATLVLLSLDEGRPMPVLPMTLGERDTFRRVIDEVLAKAPLEVRSSLPGWLCERLVASGGESLALSSSRTPPQTLRVNTLKTDREGLIAALAQQGITARPCTRSPVGVVTEGADLFRSQAFFDGLFEVQDEGSQLVALHADVKPGERVVDGCAGAGGKTLAMAAEMKGTGSITALDVHSGRLKALRERARRAGAHNIRAVDLEEFTKLKKRLKGKSDVVLVDAPCSGTGVLRRNPDTAWSLAPGDVERLVEVQRGILDSYAALVRPGGRLVYGTCSLLAEENMGAVETFVRAHPEFTADTPLVLRPDVDGTDGFFAITLRRAG